MSSISGCSEERMKWWREAKFGILIHWGLYALPAGTWKGICVPGYGEWIQHSARISVNDYERLAKLFNPTEFNARKWAQIVKEAGAKYMIVTAKHHDGFCMFDTELTDYNIVEATPFGRDPLKELAEASREEGLRLGIYYSQTLDWHHPDGIGNDWDYDPASKDFAKYVREYVKPQIKELLTNYGPVAIMWFDRGTPTPELGREIRDLVRELQPETLISGRIGGAERWANGLGDYAVMADNQIPSSVVEGGWETPATTNDTWGFKSHDRNWKSGEKMIQDLVDVVSKGGNYLLNVGPTAEGVFPQEVLRNLKRIGGWLKVNGQGIYGTTPIPIEIHHAAPYRYSHRFTKDRSIAYLHIFSRPMDGQVRIRGIGDQFKKAYLLADAGLRIKCTQEEEDLIIDLPTITPDPVVTTIVLELRID